LLRKVPVKPLSHLLLIVPTSSKNAKAQSPLLTLKTRAGKKPEIERGFISPSSSLKG
jgi:hypothetical protein